MVRCRNSLIVLTLAAATVGVGQLSKPPETRCDQEKSPLPACAVARLGTMCFRCGIGGLVLALSPEKEYVVTSPPICVWDAATGQFVRALIGDEMFWCLDMSSNGKLLAGGGHNGTIFLWDWKTGREIRRLRSNNLRREERWVCTVRFSPDGRALAAGYRGGSVHVWDITSGKELTVLEGHRQDVEVLTFCPSGKFLAWADNYPNSVDRRGSDPRSPSVRIWDLAKRKEVQSFRGHKGTVYSMLFSPDGKLLVTSGKDETIRVWESRTGREIRVLTMQERAGGCVAFCFSPEGNTLTGALRHGAICQWDTRNWKQVRRIETGQEHICNAAFSPDGKTAACNHDSVVGLWNLTTGKRIPPSGSTDPPLQRIHYSPDGRILATDGDKEEIRLWEPRTGKEICRLPKGAGVIVGYTGDSSALITFHGFSIKFWNIKTGALVQTFLPGGFVQDVALSPDRRDLVVCLEGRSMKILDVSSGRVKRRWEGCPSDTLGIAFAPDGKSIASIGREEADKMGRATSRYWKVCRWNVVTGKELAPFPPTILEPLTIVFSPDGRLLACSDGNEIELWDVLGDRPTLRLKLPKVAWRMCFSPGGEILASGSYADESVRLWEVATGKEICELDGHLRGVTGVSFSPDGRRIASCSLDCTGLVWDMIGWGQPHGQKADPTKQKNLWAELAGKDVPAAFRVAASLVRTPQLGVPLIARQLRPIPAVDAKALKHLTADLDSNKFAVRKKASETLAAMGDVAEAELRSALDRNPSLEKRKRLEDLLKPLTKWTAEQVRARRAVLVLEQIASPEARKVLRSLAAGEARAKLTRDAKAALERLAKFDRIEAQEQKK